MLKSWVKTRDLLERLPKARDGVVSFEYVIVAAGIIAILAALFGGGGPGTIQGALAAGLGAITAAV